MLSRRRLERERRAQRIGDVEPFIAEPTPVTESPQVPVVPEEPTAGTPTPPAPRDRTRNYLIWVIGASNANHWSGSKANVVFAGGYYPETHPILTSPNLLLNQFDQDDFWGLAELLGQVKPPVASKADIDRAGLEVVKAEVLPQYEKDGRVTSNTNERVGFICLLVKIVD